MARPETHQMGPQAKRRTPARRGILDELKPNETSHAGLVLDRFLLGYNGDDGPEKRAAVLGAVSTTHTLPNSSHQGAGPASEVDDPVSTTHTLPSGYRAHLQRWRTHLDTLVSRGQARIATATVDGRMILGLGAESVLEVAIALHRTYGTPFIAGSALKGLAASFSARTLVDTAWKRRDGMSHVALFGTHESAGCVVFHDALWIPDGSKERPPLDLDVMTVHHAKYYQGKANPEVPPADWDDPNPVSFITARGKYLIALEGPPVWTDVALAILKLALRREGIGAKTAAGYGRLDLAYTSTAEAGVIASEAAAEAAQVGARAKLDRQARIATLLGNLKVNNASTILPELFALTDEPDRLALALKCEEHLTRKVVRNAQREGKAWVRPLAAILNASDKDPAQ